MKIDITLDEQDEHFLTDYSWYISCGYARTDIYKNGKRRKLLLHRMILGVENQDWKIKTVDHINGNRLDNRRDNLRICSLSQNLMNVKLKKNNTSGFKGVDYASNKGKWRARIQINKKQKCLGYFDDIKDAARTYNEHAIIIFGEFAVLNKI